MNHKIGAILVSAMILLTLLWSACIVFAQPYWECGLITYCTDVVDDEARAVFSFTAVDEPQGTFANMLMVKINENDNPVDHTLSPGDRVVIDYITDLLDYLDIIEDPSSPGYYTITFGGQANSVTINAVEIPEFPAFLILPLFMVATLVALMIYRRKQVM